VIPPAVSFVAGDAFPAGCQISVAAGASGVELAGWCERRLGGNPAVDFRRILRLGFELGGLSDDLVVLSGFEFGQVLGVGGESSSVLYRRRSDGLQFVVKLIGRFVIGEGKAVESLLERVIEKQLNLRHRCIAAPIGFVVSGNGSGDAVELRTVRLFVEGGSLADVFARSPPPPRWTATAKAIAVAGLALGLRFAHGVGLFHGALTPGSVLLSGAGEIQIAGIGAIRSRTADGHGGASVFAAPEVLRGGEGIAKSDVFSFARIVSHIIADDRQSGTVAGFLSALITTGLSADPSDRPSFGAIVARLRTKGFAIVENVDTTSVLAFVRGVDDAEP
jgi:serine/threonine protein kinase